MSAARVAGLTYILVIGLGVTQALTVSSPLVVSGDPAATLDNIAANDLLFRLGILADSALYVLVLVLSVALFVVVGNVHRPMALAALVLRVAEGVVGLMVTLAGGALPLLLLESPAPLDSDAARILAASFLGLRTAGLDVVLVLVGLGGGAFCYLFFRSRCVPRTLAAWGILTYLSMLALGSARMVLPTLPGAVTGVLYAQGAVFELTFGGWLLVMAVDESKLPPRPC